MGNMSVEIKILAWISWAMIDLNAKSSNPILRGFWTQVQVMSTELCCGVLCSPWEPLGGVLRILQGPFSTRRAGSRVVDRGFWAQAQQESS